MSITIKKNFCSLQYATLQRIKSRVHYLNNIIRLTVLRNHIIRFEYNDGTMSDMEQLWYQRSPQGPLFLSSQSSALLINYRAAVTIHYIIRNCTQPTVDIYEVPIIVIINSTNCLLWGRKSCQAWYRRWSLALNQLRMRTYIVLCFGFSSRTISLHFADATPVSWFFIILHW